jgi:hypothetical protein
VVLITHPRRLILATKAAHIVSGPVEAQVRVWSAAKIQSADARIDDGEWIPMRGSGDMNWSYSIPGNTLKKGEHTLEVRVTDADKIEGKDRITFLCDLSGRYNPYPIVEPVVRETQFC